MTQQILEILQLYNMQWIWLILSALLVGMAKTGVPGVGLLVVPILAAVFGGKLSAGILLPMLCTGDIIGVAYYNRHAEWKYILKVLPYALGGIVLGLIVGNSIDDQQFKEIIAIIILCSLGIMLWSEKNPKLKAKIAESKWISPISGFAGGFATMIGNAAGPIMSIYLLSMDLPKNRFIGTAAWFFLIVNFIKVPLQFFGWESITLKSLYLNLLLVPIIIIGAISGILLIKLVPEKTFKNAVLIMTALAALKLFI